MGLGLRRCLGEGCEGWFDPSDPDSASDADIDSASPLDRFCDAADTSKRHGYGWSMNQRDWVLMTTAETASNDQEAG